MSSYTQLLQALIDQLYDLKDRKLIYNLSGSSNSSYPYMELVSFDSTLGGIGIHNVNEPRGLGRRAYSISDRDVFRPIQYCAVYFSMETQIEWLSREIVHMCGLHLESLLKRIVGLKFAPLGQALRNKIAKQKIDQTIWKHLMEYLQLYNSSKHDIPEQIDEHLFSPSDAVQSYFICRVLSIELLKHARLDTVTSRYTES